MNEILFWNADSIRAHDRLPTLEKLCTLHPYLAVALCETKLRDGLSIRLHGYHYVGLPARAKNAGGVCILVHGSVEYRKLKPLFFPSSSQLSSLHNTSVYPQCVAVELALSGKRRLVLVSVYVPPGSNKDDVLTMFACFSSMAESGVDVLVVGDCNARHRAWSVGRENTLGSVLYEWCDAHDFSVVNSLSPVIVPTFRGQSGTTLDLAVVSDASIVDGLTVCHDLPLVSNHWPVVVSLECVHRVDDANRDPLPQMRRWKFDTADWDAYAAELSEQLLLFDREHDSFADDLDAGLVTVQEYIDKTATSLTTSIEAAGNATIQRSSGRQGRRQNAQWWPYHPEVDSVYRAMSVAYKKHRDHPNSACKKERYISLRKQWKKVRRAAIDALATKRAAELEHPEQKSVFWPAYRRVKGSANPIIPLASMSSSLTQPDPEWANQPPDPRHGVETFARHFAAASQLPLQPHATTAALVNNTINSPDGPRADDHQGAEFAHLEVLNKDITAEEVGTVLRRLSGKTSVGPDCVPFALLKHGGEPLVERLCFVLNESWRLSVVPQAWRDADVLPLYKESGELEDCDNYRPISLTACLARTAERVLYPRLYAVVHPRLSKSQSGFRHQRSTTDQILAIVERARLSFKSKQPLPVVYLDIKKAFDRVWHAGLLHKLFVHFRVAGRCWRWIEAFLTGRRLRVRAKGLVSLWYAVDNGVPQGSVLAPLLFLVFINDLAEQIESVGAESPLFADDAAVMPALGTEAKLLRSVMQNALKACWKWSVRWRVEWGLKKCALVVYSNARKRPKNSDWKLDLGRNRLQRLDHYLYLGVYLQERLCWQMQFDKTIKAARFASWRVSRWVRLAESKGKVSLPVVRQLVLSCVRSCFGYALPIWRPTSAQVNMFQRTLIYPLRLCLGLPRTTSYVGILVECAVPGVRLWIEHLALRLARRVVQLPRGHSARECFELSRDEILPIERVESGRDLSSLPFGLLIFSIEARWFGLDEWSWFGVDFGLRTHATFRTKSLSLNTKELLLRQYTNAVIDGRCQHLLQLKHSSHLSAYLRLDRRSTAVIRARLRLDRAKLNSSLFDRKLVASPHCEHCRSINPRVKREETPQHLLMECPRFQAERRALIDALSKHDVKLDLRVLLGEWSAKLCKNADVLCLLRDFLLTVHAVRDM